LEVEDRTMSFGSSCLGKRRGGHTDLALCPTRKRRRRKVKHGCSHWPRVMPTYASGTRASGDSYRVLDLAC
jgi:hypothetical protein